MHKWWNREWQKDFGFRSSRMGRSTEFHSNTVLTKKEYQRQLMVDWGGHKDKRWLLVDKTELNLKWWSKLMDVRWWSWYLYALMLIVSSSSLAFSMRNNFSDMQCQDNLKIERTCWQLTRHLKSLFPVYFF